MHTYVTTNLRVGTLYALLNIASHAIPQQLKRYAIITPIIDTKRSHEHVHRAVRYNCQCVGMQIELCTRARATKRAPVISYTYSSFIKSRIARESAIEMLGAYLSR